MKIPFKPQIYLAGIFFIASFILAICEQGNIPFKYLFTSPDEVEITYLGATYLINKDFKQAHIPFDYVFNPDGDVNITLKGVKYEIDSPYNRDASSRKEKQERVSG